MAAADTPDLHVCARDRLEALVTERFAGQLTDEEQTELLDRIEANVALTVAHYLRERDARTGGQRGGS